MIKYAEGREKTKLQLTSKENCIRVKKGISLCRRKFWFLFSVATDAYEKIQRKDLENFDSTDT